MANNPLLAWTLIAPALYWIIGLAVSGPLTSSMASLALLVFGAVTFLRYGREAYRIVVSGKRNQNGDGSHLAAYGVALVALGSVYIGIFNLVWVYMGQPDHWINTAASGFGRAVCAAGFAMIFLSPDVSRKGLKLPTGIWVLALGVLAMMAAFFFGLRVGSTNTF